MPFCAFGGRRRWTGKITFSNLKKCNISGRERAIIKPEIIGEDESESEQSDEAKHSSDSEEELDQDEVNLNV